MKLDLYWETSTGCQWLKQSVEVAYDLPVDEVTKSWYDATVKEAESLLKKWQREGEAVYMYPTGEVDGKFSTDLDRYLDKLEEETQKEDEKCK